MSALVAATRSAASLSFANALSMFWPRRTPLAFTTGSGSSSGCCVGILRFVPLSGSRTSVADWRGLRTGLSSSARYGVITGAGTDGPKGAGGGGVASLIAKILGLCLGLTGVMYGADLSFSVNGRLGNATAEALEGGGGGSASGCGAEAGRDGRTGLRSSMESAARNNAPAPGGGGGGPPLESPTKA